jgi:hypothetical protein
MIETILLAGRVLLIALLFLFLTAVMRTGVGVVKGQTRGRYWTVRVTHGPKELNGLKLAITSPLVVGRAPGADIVIGEEYVSGRHARFSPHEEQLIIEDLGSTNGTQVNGHAIDEACNLADGDKVQIGDVILQVQRA